MPFGLSPHALLDVMGGASSSLPTASAFSDTHRPNAVLQSATLKRNPAALADTTFDIAIIGAGIYGISVARDAALRGLRVALVDRGDFGHATSSNHHRIIHGGLRYLQHADLKRMRESIRERSVLLRIAPHLVRPLPVLIPTYKRLLQGKLLMSAALKLNDWVSADRNRDLPARQQIPAARVISRAECLEICSGLDQPDITGGALFCDAQVKNPGRLNLALLRSAVDAGAEVANYVEASGFAREGARVTGVHLKDLLTGDALTVRARMVVNCAGPWAGQLLEPLKHANTKSQALCKSMVLVTRPIIAGKIAVGVPSRSSYSDADAMVKKGFRYFFVAPWRKWSLVGTFQTRHDGAPEALTVNESEIGEAIRGINGAFPTPRLERADVVAIFRGLVPAGGDSRGGDVQLKKHYEIRDHAMDDGIDGLVSIFGVKYTTARQVAEQTVNLIFKKLDRRAPPCRTSEIPVCGAGEDVEALLSRALREQPARLDAEILRHLVEAHGAAYGEVLRHGAAQPQCLERVAADSPVIKAEVLHGVRAEMAQKLADIVFRRTDLGTAGHPGDHALSSCAKIMAAELGWSRQRMSAELEEVQRNFMGPMHENI
jgi:glycerol-3-phosphate dehydrogenase